MRGRTPRWRWIVAGSGTLLAIAAVATAFTWSALFDYVVSRQVVLDPSSRSFPDWKAPSLPLFFDVYLFNWTNADRFPREPPMMQQLGPYRFREYRRHVNVTFHPHNGSVSYRTQRTWYFDESGAGRLDDHLTTINVLAAASVFRMRYSNIVMQKMLAFTLAFHGHRISVSKLARELLFEGYEDGLLRMSKSLPSSVTGDAPQYDRFGWFYQRNNSMDTEGHLTVTTGSKIGELPGQIIMWNHRDHLPFYEGKCSQMVGSVGEFLPRNLTEDMQLTMFIGDLCRTVHLDYIHSGSLDGVTYLKYALTENSFDDSNTCFCNGECAWAGVMNVSACRYDSPIFLSMPHFLHGDARLHELVHGLEPDPDKHSFYFAVEPKMGVPLDVAGRFQVNVYLEPNPNIALFENVPRMLFPCFWVEQHVVVNQTITTNIRRARYVLDWGSTFCACCAIFFGALVVMVSFCTKRSVYTKPQDILSEKPKDEAEIKLNPIMT